MLPTRHGLWFALVLFAMLLAAVNYNNGLAYAMTFLLGALVLVSMLHTHRNLSGLRITAGSPQPVFAGEQARFPLWLHNPGPLRRPNVWLQGGSARLRLDVPPSGATAAALELRSGQRGRLACPDVVVASAYPFGLLYTWSRRWSPGSEALVYPAPGPWRPLPAGPDDPGRQQSIEHREGDDFAGLREYRRGDSPRHIHWKAAARGAGLHTKLFSGAASQMIWLDWATLPDLDVEARLSQLCRWVLDSDQGAGAYGLRLPGCVIEPDRGAGQRHRCLQALALWEPPPAHRGAPHNPRVVSRRAQ